MKLVLDSQQTIPETQEQEAEKNSTTGASSTMEMSQDLLGAPEVLNQTAQADPSRQQVQDQQERYAPHQYFL
jgi:hypothetical protein